MEGNCNLMKGKYSHQRSVKYFISVSYCQECILILYEHHPPIHHPFVQPFNYPLVNQILTYYYVLGADVGTRDIQNGTT